MAVYGYNAPKPIRTLTLIVAAKETHATQFKTTHAKHANRRNETHVRAYPRPQTTLFEEQGYFEWYLHAAQWWLKV